MTHESSGELLSLLAFFKGQHHKFVAAIDSFKDRFAIFKAEQACYLCLAEGHFAQLFRAEIGIDAAGDDDAALSTFTQKVKALLSEELVEIDICSLLLAIDGRYLILVLLRCAEVGALVGEAALIGQPGITNLGILKKLCLLHLKHFDTHLILANELRVCSEELFRLRLGYFPWWIGDNYIEAATLIHHLVKFITPMKRT